MVFAGKEKKADRIIARARIPACSERYLYRYLTLPLFYPIELPMSKCPILN